MTQDSAPLIIKGSKGKGGSSGYRAPVEQANTLQSIQRVTLIDVISEGPIEGLLDNDRSIYLNETPLRTEGGTLTLEDVSWQIRTGTPDQAALPYDSGAEAEVSDGVEVPHRYPKGGSNDLYAGYTFTVTNSLVTRVRLTLAVQGLYETLSDQDHAGDVIGSSVGYKVVIRDSSGSVIKTYANTLTGKTTSQYIWNLTFDLSGTAPWSFTVTKTTDDSTSSLLQNDLYVSSHTEITGYSFTYPNTAMVAITASAESFSNSVPSRAYRVKGLKVKVPSNYDPSSRGYSGVWDGTFKLAWTDNPAWVFYDMVSNDRYGVARYISQAYMSSSSLCDKWFLYEISQLCDELVDNGLGGKEPRYTFNGQIMGGGDAKEVLQSIASTFHGMTYWSAGLIYARADYPADPIRTITQANVIGGQITYSTASMSERHSVAFVTWYDPSDMGKAHIEPVYDWELYRRIGYRPVETVAYGCYSRGQAVRHGRWLLTSEKSLWTASVKMGLDAFDLLPGDIVKIADPSWMGYRASGRVKSVSGTEAFLDAPFDAEKDTSYQLSICTLDGKEQTRHVLSVDGAKVTVSSGFDSSAIGENAVWSMSGSDASPRVFRVQNIREEDSATVSVDLIEYSLNKFREIEEGLILENPPSRSNLKSELNAPDIVRLTETTATVNAALVEKAIFSWGYSTACFDVTGYQVNHTDPLGRTVSTGWLNEFSYELQNVIAGRWIFRVRSRTFDGRVSPWAETQYDMAGITGLTPVNPQRISLEEWGYMQRDGVHISNIDISWTASSMSASALDGYNVYFRYSSSALWQQYGQTDADATALTLENVLTGKTLQVMVKTRSKLDILSSGISESIKIVGKDAPPSAPTGLTVSQSKADRTRLICSWTGVSSSREPDIAGYRVYLDGSQSVTLTPNTSAEIKLQKGGEHTVIVTALDNSQQESKKTAVHTGTYAVLPEDVQDFSITQASYERTAALFSWTLVPGSDIDYYEIREGTSNQPWDERTLVCRTLGDRFEIRISDESQRQYWIIAHCVGGTVSAVPQSVTALFDLNPSPPSNLSVRQDQFDSIRLTVSWDLSPDLDVTGYEVRDGAIWSSAAVLGLVSGSLLTVTIPKSHEYRIMVRAQNKAGYESAIVSAFCKVSIEPSAVTGFQVLQDGDSVDFFWNANPEPDVSSYEIREGFSWSSGQIVASGITQTSFTSGIAFERGYRYFIKARNRAGFESPQAASALLTVTDLPPKNVLLEWDDVALLDGIHDGTMWGENPATWQTAGGQFSDYDSIRWTDFGGQYALSLESGSTEGVWTSPIRDAGRLISANILSDFMTLSCEGTSAVLEFCTSQDGDTWTAWKILTPHQESFQFLQYRVVMTAESADNPPWVTMLKIVADMPDIVKAGRCEVTADGAEIEYGFEYAAPPTVVITADGAGKRAVLTAEPGTERFSVRVTDSSGLASQGTVNWTSYGY